ncbi:FCD domain-containing protein [Martelella sp. HB161492]|uniref:FCD domain-containing protein n=1 Tax=Martelella sp. HB161492 TaxID=2720726 RepID=UPI001590EA6A|nr:FCD domain-containing protein [Martelella sp. HB161492]
MGDAVKRRYQEVAEAIRAEVASSTLKPGDRLKTERQMAEEMGVSRSLVREAVITLELEGLVEVRKGSGIYLAEPAAEPEPEVAADDSLTDDIGPFELLQARQLLESTIAAFAAEMVSMADIRRMREALDMEREAIEKNSDDGYAGDELFHRLIAEATQNSVMVDLLDELWAKRKKSRMWAQLHMRVFNSDYRRRWLSDHRAILQALQMKDPARARQAMWQHLQNVRETLMALSDVDDPAFDGFVFGSDEIGRIVG